MSLSQTNAFTNYGPNLTIKGLVRPLPRTNEKYIWWDKDA